MQVLSFNQSQNFYGLNYAKVLESDRKYIQKELPSLQELGKKYDIDMTSCFSGIPKFSTIDIMVKPLKEGQSLFRRLFMPKVRESVLIRELEDGTTLVSVVQKAAKNLDEKTKLSHLIDSFG